MTTGGTPHLDNARQCFRNAQIKQPEHWKENWMHAMWKHLFYAAESNELEKRHG